MNGKAFLVAALLGLAAFAQANSFADSIKEPGSEELLQNFVSFQNLHGRMYASGEEFAHRFAIFKDNHFKVQQMNKVDSGAVYKLNQFADLTEEEFRRFYLGRPVNLAAKHAGMSVAAELPLGDVPAAHDWRDKGAVTPVKNQGQCGSCWSFSTTGNVEGVNFLKTGKLVSLSEQNLVDCDHECDPTDPSVCDSGCGGGLPSSAFSWIIKNGGLNAEDAYPYEAKNGQCRFDKSKVVASIGNWTRVSTDEKQIAAALVQYGPLSIGINAGWMQFYFGGVSNPLFCNPQKLDHGVLLVGYGTDGSKDYWVIKNSWGPSWGEKGYYRIVRGSGKCGLNTDVTTAL